MTGKRKHILTLLLGGLLMLLVFGGAISVQAADEYPFLPGMTVEGSKLTLGENAFSPNYGIAPHGDYLAEGGCSITRLEHNIASIGGYTSAYRVCDALYVGIYMDRLEDDGTWQTVYQHEEIAEDCHYLSYSINVFVTKGYYYRMRAGHIAQYGDIMESNISATDGIYFGEGGDY